jgi:hypothetical protein
VDFVSYICIGFKSASAGVELVCIMQPKPCMFILESVHEPVKKINTGFNYLENKQY